MSKLIRSISNAILALLLATVAGAADAITVTLDNPDQTVVRPDTGTTRVDFFGHILLDDGFELVNDLFGSFFVYDAAGDLLLSQFPKPTGLSAGVLFYVDVDAIDLPGLYAYGGSVFIPLRVAFTESPIAGGVGYSAYANYSVNVVAASVPEPATFGLLAIGILGFAIVLRGSRISNAIRVWRSFE